MAEKREELNTKQPVTQNNSATKANYMKCVCTGLVEQQVAAWLQTSSIFISHVKVSRSHLCQLQAIVTLVEQEVWWVRERESWWVISRGRVFFPSLQFLLVCDRGQQRSCCKSCLQSEGKLPGKFLSFGIEKSIWAFSEHYHYKWLTPIMEQIKKKTIQIR